MLQKQNVNINFSQGLDTKTDPWQVAPGKFLALQNSIFTKGGLLQKRNGYAALASLPDETYQHVTTFNGNLTAIGSNLVAYSNGSAQWVNTGQIQPMNLSVNPIVRSNTNQTQCDSVVSSNNLVCTVFADNNGSTTTLKYVITDYLTDQVIVPATAIVPSAGSTMDTARVFLLGRYFMIVFGADTTHIQYIAVSTTNPTAPLPAADITTTYTPQTTVPFDGVVANNNLYIAWNSSGGAHLQMTYIDSNLNQHATIIGPSSTHNANIVSVCADTSANTPVIWVTSYTSSTVARTFAVDQNLNTILASTNYTVSGPGGIANLTTTANNGVLNVFLENYATYSYDSSISTNWLSSLTITQAGSVTSATQLVRSVGLASKAFELAGIPYVLGVYASAYQPTYFLLNGNTGGVVAKLAYSNGSANLSGSGSYLPTGLPSANILSDGITVDIAYLYRDLIASVNKTQGVANSAGIYSQTGVNLGSFSFNSQDLVTAEIGNNLNLTGGLTMSYDGAVPVEQNFNLWPDYVETAESNAGGGMLAQQYFYQAVYEWTDAQGNIFRSAPSIPVEATTTAGSVTTTATWSLGSTTATITGGTSGLYVGQIITDNTHPTNITAGTYITSISGTTLTVNLPFPANSDVSPGDTIKSVNTASVEVDIPTLRLTYKTANPVKIVIYRWSAAQQNYYQVTSVSVPLLNDPTVDSVLFTDTQNDVAILGNSLIYTTGGVIEDIGPPASSTMTLFDDRLWLVDAEDRNLLWFSKQVIENTPVEMSDLFTMYIAPSIGAQGNTGPITALGAMDDKLIIFKEDAIYYVNGTGPDNTGLNSQYNGPIFITSTVGCANQDSIVFMPNGLMFQSDKGIWLLSRDLSTNYIGAPVEQFNSATIESALAVPGTNQVRFTLSSGITLMYDYYYEQWGTFYNIPALASTLYQGLHTFINSFGQVYQETPGLYLDGADPVLMSFTTSWLNLAGLQGYQRAYFVYILGQYLTPHKLQVSFAYDYNPAPSQTTLIQPTNYSSAYGSGSSQSPYGQGTPYGGSSNVEQWRVFLAQQRCQAFQITIQEVYDNSFGVAPGAGFTLSGLNIIAGFKNKFRPMPNRASAGGGTNVGSS